MNKKVVFILASIFLIFFSLSFADEQDSVPMDTKIVLKRTGCHGICPAYELTINADGKVEFLGGEYVKAEGRHLKTISQEKVLQILNELNSINFFELNGKYDCYEATDLPTATIAVTENGKTKQIVHYHGCKSVGEKELRDLTTIENKIDELAGIADWK